VDIDQTELPAWAELVERVQGGTMKSLPFTAENINPADPDYSAIRREVYLALHPEPEPTAEAGGSNDGGSDDGDAGAAPEGREGTTEEPTEPTESGDPESPTTPETDALAEIGAVC